MFRIGPKIQLGEGDGKGALISSIIGIVIGLGLIGLGANTYINQNQALENPINTTATITETGVDRDSSRKSGISYQPEIRFEYSFEGEQYTSRNMYPGGQQPQDYDYESEAREVTQKYSTGSQIAVYVPPGSPGEAFIKNEKTSGPLIFMALGLLFMAMAGYKFLKTSYM